MIIFCTSVGPRSQVSGSTFVAYTTLDFGLLTDIWILILNFEFWILIFTWFTYGSCHRDMYRCLPTRSKIACLGRNKIAAVEKTATVNSAMGNDWPICCFCVSFMLYSVTSTWEPLSVMKFKELYDLDPSSHLAVAISDQDNPYEQSEKLFTAVRNETFSVRLHQIAWEEYVKQKR